MQQVGGGRGELLTFSPQSYRLIRYNTSVLLFVVFLYWIVFFPFPSPRYTLYILFKIKKTNLTNGRFDMVSTIHQQC